MMQLCGEGNWFPFFCFLGFFCGFLFYFFLIFSKAKRFARYASHTLLLLGLHGHGRGRLPNTVQTQSGRQGLNQVHSFLDGIVW